MRALIADPSTDFASLDAEEFFAVLKCACGDGATNTALIAETRARVGTGAAARELHQVLFVARDTVWHAARHSAMDAVARRPHLAVEIVHLETQRSGGTPLKVSESAVEGGFTAQASLDRDGTTVRGGPCHDSTKKRATQKAVVALLTRLTGIDAPELTRPTTEPAADAPSATPAEVEAWLDHLVSRPEPDPELAVHLAARHRAGRLTARSLYLLLFEAPPHGWRAQRAAAWDALVTAPAQAPGVLSMRTQARSWSPACYVEPAEGTAVAVVTTPDGPVVGEPAVAAGTRAARASAALALVRDLAPSVTGDGVSGGPAPDGHPVALLNERAQIGVITDLTFTHEATGPAHRPVFTCAARCVHAAGTCTGTGEATSKNDAKAAAAAVLLDQVLAAELAHLDRLARARREQSRTPEGIFARLMRAGCPLGVTDRGLRIEGPLPESLTGCELGLRTALPLLLALDPLAVDGPVHPSARRWAFATRTALEAIAARRVHPAVDADGRDRWRVAPSGPPDPAVEGILDAVADTVLRPPGASLVIGDLPYAGAPRPLTAEVTEWADSAAEAAEAAGTPEGASPARLVIRLCPPDDVGLPLHASLLFPTGAVPNRAEQRLLRRACRAWPPLEQVRRDGTLGGADASQLLGPAGERLAELGVTAEWHADLLGAPTLTAGVVVSLGSSGGSGGFSPTGVADLAWQLSLDDEPLTDEEVQAAADAVDGVLRLRGRWVVLDAETRRIAGDRHAGRLTGSQALGAALTGQVTVGGRTLSCSGAGSLADLVTALRDAGSGPRGDAAPPEGLTATLRGYQQVAVHWLDRVTAAGFGALLADDMGLGKTVTVIAYRLLRRDAGPTLVVCPASLVANWEREIARFAPGVVVRRYHAAGRSLDGLADGEVVVTTYGTLLRDAERLAGVPWDLVVADEAQQVKNHRSRAARALRLLRPAARVAVTGTPVENSLSELWAILDWTNPGLFGSLTAFRDRYARACEQETTDQEAAGPAPVATGRLARLIAPFVLRRRKSDPGVAPELPDKVVDNRYVGLSREQASLYRAATDQALRRIATSGGPDRRGQVLRLVQSLRQICNSPAHYLRESPEDWDADRQAARSGKLGALDDLMEAVVLSDDAALIFTGYVTMGHLVRAHLAARGIRAEFLHGGVPLAARQQMVDRFQSGDGDALILSVRAAGTGLNLTRAGHVIHVDRPWNPAVEDQATDRAHRLGRRGLVEVHHLIAEGTVEDRIADLLARKRELTEAVLGTGGTALTELSDDELSDLVSLGTGPGAEPGEEEF
ncbi:MAG: hypothetical protein QG622_815 [Actinomycetota bacterium]|nr:hypothetical protein [Actinomycetota bacterium]